VFKFIIYLSYVARIDTSERGQEYALFEVRKKYH